MFFIRKILSKSTLSLNFFQRRSLSVHEFVSYTLLNKHGLPVPKFGVAQTSAEARSIAERLDTKDLVVKAQVLTGGRGKGTFKNGFHGGVQMVKSPKEVERVASKMLGQTLVTKQTGQAGKICKTIMVAERKKPVKEYYFGVVMERTFNGPVIISSSEGGVEIEQTAAVKPQAINYTPVDIFEGLSPCVAEDIAKKVGIEANSEKVGGVLVKMFELFTKLDASLVEVNPLIQDAQGNFYCLDAKLNFDDSAEYRQKEVFGLKDLSQEDEREIQAAKHQLNYIALDGNIGCIVNGAGLAMATMDIIKLNGGTPANFLDVGGGATANQVKEAFKIITSDPKVEAILVNIFGGIMRCDVIATGLIEAARELKMKVPIVVRLQGTKVAEARDLLASSELKLLSSSDFAQAAKIVVKVSDIVRLARESNIEIELKLPTTSAQSKPK